MYWKVYKNIILLSVLVLGCIACKKEKPNTKNNEIPIPTTEQRVLIVCEGSLGNGNAQLDVYSPQSDKCYNNVYTAANEQDLGDIFQSTVKINSAYYLCVNNSDKVLVLDSSTWKEKANIALSKPRYILPISSSHAWVGALFSSNISILNTQNNTNEGQIKMPYQNIEGMLLRGNFVYVCCWDTACHYVYKININSNQIVDSIKLDDAAPQHILVDKDDNLWVMGGNPSKAKNSFLYKINISSKTILQKFIINNGSELIKPILNNSKDSIYFLIVNYNTNSLTNGVYCISTSTTQLPDRALIPCVSYQYFWALGIDPISNNIYIGDPKGFTQKSTVSIYNTQGVLQKQFNTGIGVSSFYFD